MVAVVNLKVRALWADEGGVTSIRGLFAGSLYMIKHLSALKCVIKIYKKGR